MLVFAAISGFVFVALGAFGAHVLSGTLGANEMAGSAPGWNIRDSTPRHPALAVAMQRRVSLWFYWSGALLAFGTVLFSGSLYCPALSHLKVWVYITPVGGVCFLIGWILMLIGALRLRKKAERHE